jgi:hypothetical protein
VSQPVRLAEDRSMVVPRGHVVKTAYVDMGQIRMACRERMTCADVERAYQRHVQLGDAQMWPCPVGQWRDGAFYITDGRHSYVACLLLGLTHLLVAWLAPAEEAP